ncbi:transcription factor SPEECHLESS-like protein, partial [Tanacetum coccineum]
IFVILFLFPSFKTIKMVNDLFDPNRVAYPDDIFNILEALEGVSNDFTTPLDNSSSGVTKELVEAEHETFSPRNKRQKVSGDEGCENFDGQVKMNHVTVERNRRKQMNEHLIVLRSLMPCFYVKRV